MKKTVYIILITGIISGFPSCKTADSIYEEYLVPNGLTYPAKAMNPVTYPGKERIQISWQNGTDPQVVKARISWNNDTEWVDVDIQPGADVISRTIEPLAENTYSFIIRTYDAKGNVSVPVEVMGTVYGADYERTLINRPLKSVWFDEREGDLQLVWDKASENEAGIKIDYTDTNGNSRTMTVDSSATSATIPDFKISEPFYYSTMYRLFPSAVDLFYADYKQAKVTAQQDSELDKDLFRRWNPPGLPYHDAGSDYAVENLWDKNWYLGFGEWDYTGLYASGQNPFIFYTTFDLGRIYKLNRFKIFSRPDYVYRVVHIKRFELWGSTTPDVTDDFATWQLLGTFESVKPSGLPGSEITEGDREYAAIKGEDYFFTNPPSVRYIRVQTLELWNDSGNSPQMCEMTFWGVNWAVSIQ